MAMQRYDGVVQDTNGNAQPGVAVTVRLKSSDNVANVYSDEGDTPKTNPLTSDANGAFSFYAVDGRYTIATPDQTLPDVTLFSGTAREVFVVKPSLEERINDDTPSNDNDFFFSMGKNETWAYQIIADTLISTGTGIKCVWALPSGVSASNMVVMVFVYFTSTTGLFNSFGDADVVSDHGGVGAGNSRSLFIHGFIVTGNTAGTAHFQWAQSVSGGASTSLLSKSSMLAWRVG